MDPYLGEIRLFSPYYVPKGWKFCEGQILEVKQYQGLFSILGNVYGGDGVNTFALPDYRGRVPIHVSSTIPLGKSKGEDTHTLTINEMPQHTHQVSGSSKLASSDSPLNNTWAVADNMYDPAATMVQMNANTFATSGGSQPHTNMQPYLVMNYAIAVEGIFPTKN